MVNEDEVGRTRGGGREERGGGGGAENEGVYGNEVGEGVGYVVAVVVGNDEREAVDWSGGGAVKEGGGVKAGGVVVITGTGVTLALVGLLKGTR